MHMLLLLSNEAVSPEGKTWHGVGLTPATKMVAYQKNLDRNERLRRQLEKAIEQLRQADASGTAALDRADQGEATGG